MLLRLVIIHSFVFLAAFLLKAAGGANLLFLLPPPPDKNDDEGFAEEEEEEDKEAQQESRDLILCRALAKKNTGEEDKDEDIIFCVCVTTNMRSLFLTMCLSFDNDDDAKRRIFKVTER